MNQVPKSLTSNLPIISNLDELNNLIIDFMVNEEEELIYAFTDKKNSKCNQFFFTTHKLIAADRVPNVPMKIGKYYLTGWGGDLVIPYEYIHEIETRQYKTLFTRKNRDLSVVFKNFKTFLSSKDTENFNNLLSLIKNYLYDND